MPVCASIEKQDTNRQKQQDKQEVTEKLHIVPGNSRAKIPFFVNFLLMRVIFIRYLLIYTQQSM